MTEHRDGAFDDWLDAVEREEPYFLECSNGHGWLPPRQLCPDCGDVDLERVSLPDTGEIVTVTVTYVPTPSFEDDAPYATAIASFEDVSITGQIHDERSRLESIEPGDEIELSVTNSETTGERVLTFERV